jgi:hypothetical protein
MKLFFHTVLIVATIESVLALLATFGHRLGRTGRLVTAACTRAPLLDLAVGVFTWIPWIIAGAFLGWRGFFGSVFGEIIALYIWMNAHEWANRPAVSGPRIVKFINRAVGRWRNHVALWVTAVAYPGFLFIRLMEVAVYPALVYLLNFPKYDQAQWVNVSRQKFSGLIGHDLIWCLYCDWMTGVYSLGAEMLRNVESFWCPIRFYDGKKCDNCKLDFPDINGGWVAADGDMAQVNQKMEAMYADGQRTWFGHPQRVTINGRAEVSRERR